jgi:hypothetical protein
MKKIIIFLVGICMCLICQAQVTGSTNTTGAQYIEGARLVIDILQLFKKSNVTPFTARQQKRGSLCNFCLFNSDTTQRIKVTLVSKNIIILDPIILVIKPNQKECSFQIQCGIYNCKVEGIDEKVISWGDIYINEKEVLLSR